MKQSPLPAMKHPPNWRAQRQRKLAMRRQVKASALILAVLAGVLILLASCLTHWANLKSDVVVESVYPC